MTSKFLSNGATKQIRCIYLYTSPAFISLLTNLMCNRQQSFMRIWLTESTSKSSIHTIGSILFIYLLEITMAFGVLGDYIDDSLMFRIFPIDLHFWIDSIGRYVPLCKTVGKPHSGNIFFIKIGYCCSSFNDTHDGLCFRNNYFPALRWSLFELISENKYSIFLMDSSDGMRGNDHKWNTPNIHGREIMFKINTPFLSPENVDTSDEKANKRSFFLPVRKPKTFHEL